MTNLSINQLKRAVQLKEQIARLENELASVLGSNSATRGRSGSKPAAPAAKSGAKRTMSAEGRARISAAAKARWAKINAAKGK